MRRRSIAGDSRAGRNGPGPHQLILSACFGPAPWSLEAGSRTQRFLYLPYLEAHMCAKRRPGVTSSRRSRRAFAPPGAAPAPEGSLKSFYPSIYS